MKDILKKTLKFISSRLTYLIIGIFLAIGATYVYAAWNDAKTGDSGQLSQSNWNTLVNEVHNKCGTNCDAIATAATTANNILTENNWNSLADLLYNTLVDCTDNNGGKCFINQASKSALDIDLTAGNIKNGVNVFGITGNVTVNEHVECRAGTAATCYTGWHKLGSYAHDLCFYNANNNWWGIDTEVGSMEVGCSNTGWGSYRKCECKIAP